MGLSTEDGKMPTPVRTGSVRMARVQTASVVLGLVLALALAAPAGAFMHCRAWTHLDQQQKHEALLTEVDRIVNSNDARKYGSINKVNVRKCLTRRVPEISDQMDGICADKKKASMQALNRELERYIWSCVGGRSR